MAFTREAGTPVVLSMYTMGSRFVFALAPTEDDRGCGERRCSRRTPPRAWGSNCAFSGFKVLTEAIGPEARVGASGGSAALARASESFPSLLFDLAMSLSDACPWALEGRAMAAMAWSSSGLGGSSGCRCSSSRDRCSRHEFMWVSENCFEEPAHSLLLSVRGLLSSNPALKHRASGTGFVRELALCSTGAACG